MATGANTGSAGHCIGGRRRYREKPPLLSGSCRALCHRFQQPDDSKSPGANINRNTVHNLRLAGFKNISVTDLWFDIVKKIIAVNVK